MAAPVVVANWKMHTTRAEARALAAAVRDGCRTLGPVRVVLCPPFTALGVVGELLQGSGIGLGAQDAHWEASGPFTGAVSPRQLADLGVSVVILGHSERRQHFAETDEVVRRKVTAVLAEGLTPLVCVGETEAERAAGRTAEVVTRQLRAALALRQPEAVARCWVAYEPVWAIGTGRTPTPGEVAAVHEGLRRELMALGGAGGVPVLYGGSIRAGNVGALMAEPAVDGGLVGGASLSPDEFLAVVRGTLEAKTRARSAAG